MDQEAVARLRRNLSVATEDVLVALGNKGLVRRAAKDLEKGPPPTVEEADHALLVRGQGWTVTMPPDGPSAATDDTAASGITRHILCATMFLRDTWAPSEGEAEPGESNAEQSVLEIDFSMQEAADLLAEASTADLFKWAGKTPLLEAAADIKSNATIELSPQLAISFPEDDVRVILTTDRPSKTLLKLLAQFKSTVPKSDHPRWVLQAVLAIKTAAGKSTNVENDPGAELTQAIREDRQRVAKLAGKLLRSVAATGIAHPSTRIVERFQTASVAADAARFPRLSRLLNSIADDAKLQIARDAGADPTRVMQRIVVAHALAAATARPENEERVDLFGRPRTNYTLVPKLHLSGVGAYRWRTASGYEGLTTLFWDKDTQRFLTATSARGEGQDLGFSAAQAYYEGMGWSGGQAVRDMCRQEVRLTDAKVNAEGRLSSTENCSVALGDTTRPHEINFGDHDVSSWDQLSEIAKRSQPMGLRIPDSRAAYVVLRPESWGERWFNELDQAFVWQLFDKRGAIVELRIPWTEPDENSIAFLESLKVDRDKLTAILGRLEVRNNHASVYPFSTFSEGTIQGDTILCPQFDQDRVRSRNESLLQRLRKKFNRQKPVDTRLDDSELVGTLGDEVWESPPVFQNLYVDLERILISALESGATTLPPSTVEALEVMNTRLEALGLQPLSVPVSDLLNRQSVDLPDAILSAAYRLQLYRQALRLSTLMT